jgi:hypothetical protein
MIMNRIVVLLGRKVVLEPAGAGLLRPDESWLY